MSTVIEAKTADLTGTALNWAVATAIGAYAAANGSLEIWGCKIWSIPGFKDMRWDDWTPSTDWGQGGVLVDEHIGSLYRDFSAEELPTAVVDGTAIVATGDTYLIAVCRAIVAAKLGDTVPVPEDLITEP